MTKADLSSDSSEISRGFLAIEEPLTETMPNFGPAVSHAF